MAGRVACDKAAVYLCSDCIPMERFWRGRPAATATNVDVQAKIATASSQLHAQCALAWSWLGVAHAHTHTHTHNVRHFNGLLGRPRWQVWRPPGWLAGWCAERLQSASALARSSRASLRWSARHTLSA